MDNNSQNPASQSLRPPTIGSIGSQGFGTNYSMQYLPAVPPQQGQPYMQSVAGSQQYRPIGQTQLPQFSQPMQQQRPGQPGQPGQPMSYMQPPQFQNSATTNSHVPNLGAPSYTFNAPSFGQPTNVSSQFHGVSQMHTPVASAAGQPWMSSGNQVPINVTSVPQTGQPPSTIPLINQQASNTSQDASADWQEYTAGDGRRYYYNKRTKQSSWEKPLELMTPLERADASTVWKEFTTAEGKKYYYNKDTKQSKWTIPDELKLARELAEKEASRSTQSPATLTTPSALDQPSASANSANDVSSSPLPVTPVNPVANVAAESASVTPAAVTPVISTNMHSSPMAKTENLSSHVAPKAVDGVSAQDTDEAKKGMAVAGKVNTTPVEEKPVEDEQFIYASKQEAKVAFKQLLEDANVKADWNWEQAMRVIINDKRYGALKALGERKQAFNEYLMQRKKVENEERRLKQRKAKEEFTKMLEESKELTSSMRWSKAIALFEDDERYKAVDRSADREDLFQNYLVDLQKKERAKAQEEQRQYRSEYRQFLETCGLIKVDTQWRKVQDRLEDDERCSRLEKIDRLEIFQEYIRDLEKEEDEQRKIKKEHIKRVERKNRDEFRKMLEEHVASGTLNAKTQWRDYCQKVKESVAYQAVASNTSGSTPKDLFEDVVEELEKKYHEDKSRVKDGLKLKKVSVLSTWTLEDLKAAIADEEIMSSLSDINLQLVFEDLIERAKEKEEKEIKKRQRLVKDFTDLLYDIKEITASSTWEECQQLFEESTEYRAIGDESIAREAFEEYISRLVEKAKEKERKREEEKARKEEKEKRKEKERREKEKEREERDKSSKEKSKKDDSDSENLDLVTEQQHKDKDDKRRDRKHRKRHQDDVTSDKDERDESKKSRRHATDRKKSRKHAYSPESDGENKHKKHKKESRSKNGGGNEELEDGELGEDGEIQY